MLNKLAAGRGGKEIMYFCIVCGIPAGDKIQSTSLDERIAGTAPIALPTSTAHTFKIWVSVNQQKFFFYSRILTNTESSIILSLVVTFSD